MTLKLDLGCGPHPKEGFVGLDIHAFADDVIQVNLAHAPWIFSVNVIGDIKLEVSDSRTSYQLDEDSKKVIGSTITPTGFILPDNCVDEVSCSHFLEHLEMVPGNNERVQFVNELHRVMKVGAGATIVVPHWCSNRAYGDPTHAAKPVSEMFHYYLSREWRLNQAPHTDIKWNKEGLDCDFECTWGYSVREDLQVKNQEQQMFALANYKEAAQDLVASWKKKEPQVAAANDDVDDGDGLTKEEEALLKKLKSKGKKRK